MAQPEAQGLVLADSAGNYYLLSSEDLRRARVSEERKAELQRALGADVSGYITPIPIPEGSALLLGSFTLLGIVTGLQHAAVDPGGGIDIPPRG
ncbi:MAG TPA: hypothetical protein VKV26_14800 [Dehalococcoidia bacterium]|nr:hypothetical protein [Dehalococcoidia bacterium]